MQLRSLRKSSSVFAKLHGFQKIFSQQRITKVVIKSKKFGLQILRMLLHARKKHGVGARTPKCEISLKTNTAVCDKF